jgi:hypothetical protein
MSNTLLINTNLVNDHWEITATMSIGTLPSQVFICLNTATNIQGNYVGVCSLDELSRLQIFSGVSIPIFGNKYIRSDSVKIVVSLNTSTALIISTLVSGVNLLNTAYKAQTNSTQVFTII